VVSFTPLRLYQTTVWSLRKTPWPKCGSQLYRPSDRRLLAKLVPTFADRGCHVVSVTDPFGRILGFLLNRKISLYCVAQKLFIIISAAFLTVFIVSTINIFNKNSY
jgi:hypothetical protein